MLTTDNVLLTVWPGEDGGVEGGEGDVEGAGGGGGGEGHVCTGKSETDTGKHRLHQLFLMIPISIIFSWYCNTL